MPPRRSSIIPFLGATKDMLFIHLIRGAKSRDLFLQFGAIRMVELILVSSHYAYSPLPPGTPPFFKLYPGRQRCHSGTDNTYNSHETICINQLLDYTLRF
jgi:hypothetical protein